MLLLKQYKSHGFTLVEIMIVVAVIGLLAALMIPAFAKARRTSQIQKCIQNQRAIYQAVMRYEIDHNATLFSVRGNGVQIRNIFLTDGYMNPQNNFDCPNSPLKDFDDYILIYGAGESFQTTQCTIVPAEHILP